MGRRTQADRDAITIEIGYAVVSGVAVAAVTCAGIYVPAMFLDLTRTGEHLLFKIAVGAAAVVFLARVVHVLRRFPRPAEGRRVPDAQPSQPGRTSPDS
ncbi:DUF6332 family protein [Streptomyces sp. NBC_00654]|uniref:DUF6332 family protein n=1 Tax=Streptomyces sp. NBC_00654 TaxID=2975799 RepID=UPI0022579436|nr:DUF6332 family protein [Streptomyces sp. NBC_00654]MCX4967822.1 DUF6332 family protein [Streptomyces sp. NBC_00654]